jgi:hypothetical protein
MEEVRFRRTPAPFAFSILHFSNSIRRLIDANPREQKSAKFGVD